MGKYAEEISDNSIWITVTPNETVKKLPFYISEIGHFFAAEKYYVERAFHNSNLLLYTVKGCGTVISNGSEVSLERGNVCIIDCKTPHKYYSQTDEWEFIWFHFNSSSDITDFINKDGFSATELYNKHSFLESIALIMDEITSNTLESSFNVSNYIHSVINCIYKSQLKSTQLKPAHSNDIDNAILFIHRNFSSQITIDDITKSIHMSKYHFIRTFRKIMGVTPYSYITAYRINQSKIMLRTSDKTVSDIAFECGFFDTSNYITHFKKHTGETPLNYRKDFV